MRIAFVQGPPVGGIASGYLVHEPLNLIGLATAARDLADAEVQVWDYQVVPYSDADLLNRIDTFKPDIVGLTAMTSQVRSAAAMAETIKQHRPGITTIVGGQHPTALPQRTLEQFPAFDIAVIGEGEQTVSQLCRDIPRGRIPGLAIRIDGKIMETQAADRVENLDEVPIPDRDIVDRALYRRGPVVLGVDRSFANPITVNLSRGCPFCCDFCSANIVYGRKVRFRSIENIEREIHHCVERYGINHVSINDSLFTFRRSFTEQVAELFARYGLTWDCRARADEMDRDFAHFLAQHGCIKVFMGSEAGTQRVLNLINKELSVEQIEAAFAYTKEAGIIRGTQFVVGAHPSQTEAEVMESLALAKRIDPEYCSFSIIMPLPGTRSYELFDEQGLFLTNRENWDAFVFYGGRPAWRTEHLSPDDLVRLQKRCMLSFYMRPGYLWRRLRIEAGAGRLGYHLRSAWTLARFAVERRLRITRTSDE